MKNKKNCEECKTPYQPTRSDQKFCGATCRWNAWRKDPKNQKETKGLDGAVVPEKIQEEEEKLENKNLFSSLRGVPETKIPETKQEQIKIPEIPPIIPPPANVLEIKEPSKTEPVETKEYKEAILEKQRVDTFGQRVISDLQTIGHQILEIKRAIEECLKSKNSYPKNRYRNTSVDFQDLFGEELSTQEFNKTLKLQDLQQKLKDEELNRLELSGELDKANKEMNIVMRRLKTIPQFEKPKLEEKPMEKNVLRLHGFKSLKSKKEIEEKKIVTEIEPIIIKPIETDPITTEETNVFEGEDTLEEEPDTSNDKLVSSRDLRKRKYNCFPFDGKWKDFFGLPSYAFHLAVHGKPGEGKSTFCVQFADYLAKNFGKVVYVSGEEGLSKTVQDKIINNGIDNPYLFFADIKSFNEIKTEIPNEYHFIFIDSLDTLRIDSVKLKELKEHYPQSAFITISQSTKDGKMRGSQEITHDTDIAAKVENGIAITTKNRFQARGTEFKVFDNFQPTKKKIEEPKLLKISEHKNLI